MALNTAIRHLQRGDWEKAHAIVQNDNSELGCWAHGIVHMLEGDLGNARYWFRRAGRPFPRGTRRERRNRCAGGDAQGTDGQAADGSETADGRMKSLAAPIPPAFGIRPEIAVQAMPDDERVWVPQAPDVWFRPLLLNTVSGGWCNLLRVRRSGVLSRHRHPMLVVGYVIKGRWRYLEHDWIAEEGSFVFEPPGEVHTLIVPADCAEMITFFNISGAMIYLDERGPADRLRGRVHEIEMCRTHYRVRGLGAAYVDQFIR